MRTSTIRPVISTAESLFLIGFYIFFACLYYTTLWIVRDGYNNVHDPYFNLKSFLNWGGIDYLLKFILSLAVIWLIFFKLRHVSLSRRLIIHCVILLVFVVTWQKLYYSITDFLGMFHLTGAGKVWDLYIPALFYILEFGILHAYIYFRQNQERIQLEAELKEAALKSELAALKAQLNPHFLYNVFNAINASIPPDLEQTRQMIAELSDLFRYQLQASKSDMVPLRDELEFTRKYLDLEKARFEERLQIEIIAEETLLDELIPPMLIQPLVENAVKHGISPLVSGGKISVCVKRRAHQLVFCITDTGVGTKEKELLAGKGTGLTNTALRLDKMFGTKLELTDSVPHGLTINFAIG